MAGGKSSKGAKYSEYVFILLRNELSQQSHSKHRINFIVGTEKTVFSTSIAKAKVVSPVYIGWIDASIARAGAHHPPLVPFVDFTGVSIGCFRHIHLYIEKNTVVFGSGYAATDGHSPKCECGFVGLWGKDQVHDNAIVKCTNEQHDPTDLLFAIAHAHRYHIPGFISMAGEKLLAAATSAYAANIVKIIPSTLRFERGVNAAQSDMQSLTLLKLREDRVGPRFAVLRVAREGTPTDESDLRYGSVLGPYEAIISH